MTEKMKFNRSNAIEFDFNDDDNIVASAHLHDVLDETVMHDINLKIIIEKDTMDIVSIDAKVNKPDYLKCQEALSGLNKLEGLNILKGFTKQVISLVGGVEGCFHLNNMIMQVGAAALLSDLFKTREGIDKWKDWVEMCKKNPENFNENVKFRISQVPPIENSCYVCQIR